MRFEPLEPRELLAITSFAAEFQVNTFATGAQTSPAVAADSAGDFVAVWTSAAQDGDEDGVFGQRFTSAGQKAGTEFQVNATTANSQTSPAVAIDSDGDFVVVWEDETLDGDDYGIFAQRFNAAGQKIGGEFQVNEFTTMSQDSPAVAMDAAGAFVVVWETEGAFDGSLEAILARRFGANGQPLSGEILVNTTTAGSQRRPDIAMRPDGGFVVTWEGPDSNASEVFAQRFDAAGQKLGGEILVNTTTVGTQWNAAIATNASGAFAVAWASPDANMNGVFAQLFDAAGQKVGGEFQVNLTTAGNQSGPSVAMDSDGDIFIAWHSPGDGGSYGVFARAFDRAGIAQTDELIVNTFRANNQTAASVAMDSDGDLVVAWNSYEQDGSAIGVFAQQFRPLRPQATALVDLFQVNATSSFSSQEQEGISAAADAAGNLVIVWESFGQDVGGTWGIYAQRHDVLGRPVGGEFRVNTTTAGDQRRPDVAMDDEGDFVVAWESSDADGIGVFAQRFSRFGTPLGSQFQVNTTTAGDQNLPAVGADADGDFAIAWEGPDASGRGVFAQRFNAAGQALGGELPVNTVTGGPQRDVDVAMDADGDFVVTFTGPDGSLYGIFARRYNAAGAPLGAEFGVNAITNDQQLRPAVAMAPGGAFAVAWSHFPDVPNLFDIYRRRFDANGAPLEEDFLVSTILPEDDDNALSIAMDDLGRTVVAWQGDLNIYSRVFGVDGTPLDDQFVVAAPGPANVQNVALAIDADGEFAVAFSRGELVQPGITRWDVHAQRYSLNVPLVGPIRHVNTFVADQQRLPEVAGDFHGNTVVVWESNNQDGDMFGVFGQRYNAAGQPVGLEFRANTETDGNQARPGVAMDADGDHVVVWASFAQDGDGYGVYAQRYNAAGQPVGGEFPVNTTTANNQEFPHVAMDAAGNFVVVWENDNNLDGNKRGVIAKLYNADGSLRKDEFQVNTFTAGNQARARVTMDASGDFVVVWHSEDDNANLPDQDGSGHGVFAQRFDSAGNKVGGEFRVNTFTDGDQSFPSVAMDADGDFVAAWTSYGQDNGDDGVYAQRFSSAGAAVGGEFQVNLESRREGFNPHVAMAPQGTFAISWSSFGAGLHAQLYAAGGAPLGQEFRVDPFLQPAPQFGAGLAADGLGGFVAVWDGAGPGDTVGVFRQGFLLNAEVDLGLPDVVGRTAGGDWWVGRNDGSQLVNEHAGGWDESLGWRDVIYADFTGEGFDDILARTSSGLWRLVPNTGSGPNVAPLWQPFGAWNEAADWRDVLAGDFDGDGRSDVIGRTSGGQWWLGRNDGASMSNHFYGVWSEAAGWQDVRVVDFDLDGDDDLLGRAAGGDWWLGRNTGSGLQNVHVGNWAPISWNDVGVADFNRDGFPDVIGRTDGGDWWIGRNDFGAGLTNQAFGVWGAIPWNDVAYGDFDSNGDTDAIGRTDGGAWWVGRNNAGAGFVNVFFGTWAPIDWRDTQFADFDGNGFLDALARAPSGDWWLAQNGGAAFVASVPFGFWNEAAGWRDVSSGDFRGTPLPPADGSAADFEWSLAAELARRHDDEAVAADVALRDSDDWIQLAFDGLA